MADHPEPTNFIAYLCRPYRKALYTNPHSVAPYLVNATEAAMLKAEFPDAEFFVRNQRVYPKPNVGTFAKWPCIGIRMGETAPESQVHLAAKAALVTLLESGETMTFQPVARRSGNPIGEPFGVQVVACRQEAPIRPKRARSNLQPDVLLQIRGGRTGNWAGLEVRNTHAVDYGKRRRLKLLPMTTLEIDVRGFLGRFWLDDELKEALLQWFSNNGVRVRIITMVGEDECRPIDDPILLAAMKAGIK